MANLPSENYDQPDAHEHDENRDKKPEQKGAKSIDEKNLTPNEVRRLQNRETSIDKLVEQRLQLKAAAEDELHRLLSVKKGDKPILERKEKEDFEARLEAEQSPEKTEAILKEIKALPETKEKEQKQAAKEEKKLTPEHPDILKVKDEFNTICDKNTHLIGTDQVEGFKTWFVQQIWRNPTVANAKDIVRRLEGKSISDTGGLAPRREEFGKLEKIFKKYDIVDGPLTSKWIAKEGLKERTTFRETAEQLEEIMRKQKELGFCSDTMISETMQQILLADNPTSQKEILTKTQNIARQEATGFTHLDKKIFVGGKDIRAMSLSSKTKYLDYYKNTNFEERGELVVKWPNLVHNEAKLAYQLRDIYGEDTENLKIALDSFGEMDFMEKQAELKVHTQLVREIADKKEREKTLVIKAATAKIQTAAKDGYIRSKTVQHYIAIFEDPNKFKNIHTGKPGDIDEMKKAYDILKNPTPDHANQNLAAFKDRRNKYAKDLTELQEENTDLTENEIKEKQKKYDEEGWIKRERIHDELKLEITKAKKDNKENAKQKNIEEKAGVDEDKTQEIMSENLSLDRVRAQVFEFFADKQYSEAMNVLVAFNNQNPDNPEILILMQTALDYMKQFGSGKKAAENLDDQIEEELDNLLAQKDKSIEHQLTEIHVETKLIEGARQNKQQEQTIHSNEIELNNSLEEVDGDDLATSLVQSAYKQLDDGYYLDEEGKGKTEEEAEFSKSEYQETELQHLKQAARRAQGGIDSNKGMTGFQLIDKDQKDISADQAETKEAQGDRLDLEQELAAKIEDKITAKTTGGEDAKVFNLHEKAAAARAAKARIDKRRFSKIAA